MDKTKKTICFFNSNKAWGGGEKWHFTTAQEFGRRGYKTFLATNNPSELANKAIQERLEVFRFQVGNLSFLNPIKVFVLAAFFKAKKVDTIILNLPSDLKYAGIAAKVAGVRNIIYRRGMPHPLRNTWLNRFLFTKILTHVVVNSQEIGRTLKEGNEDWFPLDKMVLIYNGVDTKRPRNREKKVFEKVGDQVVIGNAGRLTEQKGQKYLIEMAEQLKKENLNFVVLIAGEGELKASLQQLINEKNLQSEVKLIGHVDDMEAFMNSLDVFVFPSLFEGSANTLIESLQFEVPAVAFNISSNPEVIVNASTGLLAEPFNVSEFTNQTLKIIRDQNLQKMIPQNGLTLLSERFDQKRNLDELEKKIQ